MKKKNKLFIILTTIFATTTVVFLCLFLSFCVTSATYQTQLENTYMKSFYELVDNVNTLEVDLSKVIATNKLSSQRELLDDIYSTCLLGVTNINNLPINNEKLTEINKILNTSGGFAYSLLLENFKGNLITNEDYLQINNIYDKVRELQYDINKYIRELKYDYSILDDVNFGDVNENSFSGGIVDTESSSAEVPTLIYDGPFSDSVLNKEIKGLPSNEFTLEEVEFNLATVFTNSEIKYIGETLGKFETYNFELKGDIDLYVSVTKRGGFLLNISAFGGGSGNTGSIEEGINHAEEFAINVGLENMYSVWHQQSGNILYVNLAPIKDHVIYYSDLVKVKVDLSLMKIVGWEATAYATNHVDRSFSSSIGILDAQDELNSNLKIVERNLSIIPDKFVGELSAYEFICEWEDYTYYIYIDSHTGEEIDIMRVIETSNGNLLM